MEKGRYRHRQRGWMQVLWAVTIPGILVLGLYPVNPVVAGPGGYTRASYVLPPDVKEHGFTFAGVRIPLDRREVAERVVDQVNFLLMDRRAGMMEWFDRMAVFGPMIRKVLVHDKLPKDMIYLSALVSDLLPNATTKSGGVGWWALGSGKLKNNPSSQQWVSTNDWDDRRDPVLSTRIAGEILQGLVKRIPNNDLLLALAAYLDGVDAVSTIAKKAPGFSFWDMPMPPYSEKMIPRLVALKLIDSHRKFYGVDIPRLPPLTYDYLDRLKLTKDLPLHVVAKWCGSNPRSMWELNPGVDPSTGVLPKADRRSPSGFPLRVPKGMGTKVRRMLVREGYLSK